MEENELLEEEKYGIKISQIFKWIWAKKILGLIVWAAVTIVLFLGLMYVINPRMASYEVQFAYKNCSFTNGNYADGTKFDINDLVTRSVVDEVVANDDELKDFDTDKLFRGNGLALYVLYTYRDASIKDYTIIQTNYKILAPLKSFKNQAQAIKLFTGIVEYPINKEKDIIAKLNFTNNFKLYENSTMYDSQITYLNSQVGILNEGYSNWIEIYGDVNLEYNNSIKKLSEFKSEVNQCLSEQHFSSMSNDLYLYGYVKNDSLKSEYEKQLATLKLAHTYLNGYESTTIGTKVRADNTLDNLTAQQAELNAAFSGGGTVSILQTEAYTSLINKVAEVNAAVLDNDKQQDDIQRKLAFIASGDKTASVAFGNKLDSIEAKLKEYTSTYTEINNLLKNRNMQAYYSYSNIIKETGSFKTIVVIVGSVCIGLITGIAVAWIAGWAKFKKDSEEEAKEESVSE